METSSITRRKHFRFSVTRTSDSSISRAVVHANAFSSSAETTS